MIGDVRGRGLMLGVEFSDCRGRIKCVSAFAKSVQRKCFENGLLIELGGRKGAVARFLPPLIITEQEIDRVVEIFAAAMRSATREHLELAATAAPATAAAAAAQN